MDRHRGPVSLKHPFRAGFDQVESVVSGQVDPQPHPLIPAQAGIQGPLAPSPLSAAPGSPLSRGRTETAFAGREQSPDVAPAGEPSSYKPDPSRRSPSKIVPRSNPRRASLKLMLVFNTPNP